MYDRERERENFSPTEKTFLGVWQKNTPKISFRATYNSQNMAYPNKHMAVFDFFLLQFGIFLRWELLQEKCHGFEIRMFLWE